MESGVLSRLLLTVGTSTLVEGQDNEVEMVLKLGMEFPRSSATKSVSAVVEDETTENLANELDQFMVKPGRTRVVLLHTPSHVLSI